MATQLTGDPILIGLQNSVNTANAALVSAKNAVTLYSNTLQHYQQSVIDARQRLANAQNQAETAQAGIDIQAAISLVNTTEGQANAANAALPIAQKAYDNAVAALNTYSNNPQTAALEASTASALIKQGTTTYLIWGAIALVVIVAGVILFKKHFNKAA